MSIDRRKLTSIAFLRGVKASNALVCEVGNKGQDHVQDNFSCTLNVAIYHVKMLSVLNDKLVLYPSIYHTLRYATIYANIYCSL